jgi:hypothetical protein
MSDELNPAMSGRRDALIKFYSILDRLDRTIGGTRLLTTCSGRLDWPKRGVYFFREGGEHRRDTGDGPRIVRVGTHGLKSGSQTALWTRLSQHKGQQNTGGGDHRGSIFRQIVGGALIQRDELEFPTWGDGYTASRDIRLVEIDLERRVSEVIGKMTFLWLAIEDEAGPESLRGYIERNSIALLSNYRKPALDPPSSNWLGDYSVRQRVRASGLWNQNHVDEAYDPAFLDSLDQLIQIASSAV